MLSKNYIQRIAAAALLAGCAFTFSITTVSCRKEQNELAHHHDHHGHEDGEHTDHDGHDHADHDDADEHQHNHRAGEIILESHDADRFGVKTREVKKGDFYEAIEVTGELVSEPSAASVAAARSTGILSFRSGIGVGTRVAKGETIATINGRGIAGGDSNEAAQATLNAAKRELDRVTPLHKEGIVSTKDYNAALMAYESAKAAAGNSAGAGSAVTAPTSGVITSLEASNGEVVALGAPIATISSGNSLMLKALLPARNKNNFGSISGARFRTAADNYTQIYDISEMGGRRADSATGNVSNNGYLPVTFSFTNPGDLTAGTFCEVFLTTDRQTGIISVPESALSEQQGLFFVYVKIDDDCYEKRPVTLGGNSGGVYEVTSGLKEGENVVVEGTTFVRLAESSGKVPEGHSHSH